MNKPIAILGAGGLGREIRNLLERYHQFAGFYDDNEIEHDYLGVLSQIPASNYLQCIIAIGDPIIKKKVVSQLEQLNLNYATLISKHAVVLKEQLKGEGTVICDGVITTVDCKIGSHVLLNINATVGHDVSIGDYCSIMPGANISGNVTIGEATLIGSGAVILQGITIGFNVKVGAGAVVTKNVPDNTTVVGVPAKSITTNQ